jgi:hypothetical protein
MKYGIIKNLIPIDICNRMVLAMNSTKDVTSNPKLMSIETHILFNIIHTQIQSKVEDFFKVKLVPTYNYCRIYHIGGILPKHRDRPSCEYSVTVNLKQEGNGIWPIFMDGESVDLSPSDGGAYKGCEVSHWREENDIGKCHQIFFHFVEENGPNYKWAYDKKEKHFFKGLQSENIML